MWYNINGLENNVLKSVIYAVCTVIYTACTVYSILYH